MTAVEPLQLPGLTLTDMGAEVHGTVDRGAVLAAVTTLLAREAQTRWQVGDLIAALIEDDGDPARTFRDLTGTGYEQAWLSGCLAVSMRVAPAQRRPGLSWGHHELVAHMDPEGQDQWLGQAVLAQMSQAQLRDAIKNATQGQLDTGSDLPVRIVAPKTAMVRAVLAANPQAWVLWQPSTGDMRRAER